MQGCCKVVNMRIQDAGIAGRDVGAMCFARGMGRCCGGFENEGRRPEGGDGQDAKFCFAKNGLG